MESAGIARPAREAPGAVEEAPRNGNGPPGAVRLPGRNRRDTLAIVRGYVALTKPRILGLLLWTTLTTMFVADPSGPPASLIAWTMLGGYLAAGGAAAINHYLDRHVDARMSRTRGRPLVDGRIPPRHGLWFGIGLGAASMAVLALAVNPLSAALSLAGLLGYAFMYTAWLKPRTPQNIVIGGAAGAVPPLVGWAAATGGLSLDALYPFTIVFLWTPPHFWALSLLLKDDYERIGVPMLPVVHGDEATRRQILAYTVVLVGVSILPVLTGLFGAVYLAAAAALGSAFIALSTLLATRPSRAAATRVYVGSLLYVAALFAVMAVDRVVG